MDELKTEFRFRLREALNEKNISQAELARRTGLTRSAISQYLSGVYEASQTPLYLIAKALNVSEAWLMGYDVSKTRAEDIKVVVTPDEKEFLDIFTLLNEKSKESLKQYMQFLFETQG